MRTPRRWPRLSSRLQSLLSGLAILVGLVACDEQAVTAPKLVPGAPSLNIDVTPGTMAFDVHMNGAPLTGIGPNSCPFRLYIDPAPPQNFGMHVREVCSTSAGTFATTVPNLPMGMHTFDLRFNTFEAASLTEPQPVVASATVTLSATTQATATFEIGQTMGLVEGTLTVDGQPLPTQQGRYSVCTATGGQIAPCAQAAPTTGAFKLLDLVGDRVGYARSGPGFNAVAGAPISYFNYRIEPGQTSPIGAMNLVTSRLQPVLRFGTQSLADLGVFRQACGFLLHVDRAPDRLNFQFGPRVANLCGPFPPSIVLGDMPVGEHTFDLRFQGPPATANNPQPVVGTAQVSLDAGATASADFDLSQTMGLVTGTLIPSNWDPPLDRPLDEYVICLATNQRNFPCIRPQITGPGQADFAFLDMPGHRLAFLRRNDATQATVGSFTYAVEQGGTTSLGTVRDSPPLKLQFKFNGVPLDGLGASPPFFTGFNCPFQLWRDPVGTNQLGTFVQTICADDQGSLASARILDLAPGPHTIQVRYTGPPIPGHSGFVASKSVTIETGATFTQDIELEDQMGLVTGTLTINGQVPPVSQRFQVCARNSAGFGGPCAWVSPDGGFKFVDLPGARSALVKVVTSSASISDFAFSVAPGRTTIVGTTTGGVHGETPEGEDITVTPVLRTNESGEDERPVTLTFTNVGTRGTTAVSEVSGGPPPPLEIDAVTIQYEITTSAVYTGTIDVCINYPAGTPRPEDLQLFHYENGEWKDVTKRPIDLTKNVICGTVSSLSPFFIGRLKKVAPIARLAAPATADEGTVVTFDARGSSDRDGTIQRYEWDLDGDGTFEVSGTTPEYAMRERAFADEGSYTVAVQVTDDDATSHTASVTVAVTNVVPAVVGMPATVTLIDNETHRGAGSFTDPGADSWTATVSYGEGAASALALTGKTFELSHTYRTPGRFTIAVSVSDGDNGTGTGTTLVVVQTHKEAVLALIRSLVEMLAPSLRQSLVEKLEGAIKQLERGHYRPAIDHVEAYKRIVAGLVRARRLTPAQGATLTAAATRVIRAMELEHPEHNDDDDDRSKGGN